MRHATTEERDYVESISSEYRAFIAATPGLMSALYDVDLLPEQLLHVLRVNPPAAPSNAARMALICNLWRKLPPEPKD